MGSAGKAATWALKRIGGAADGDESAGVGFSGHGEVSDLAAAVGSGEIHLERWVQVGV